MQASSKSMLKSIGILALISLVCVAILSLANATLKSEPTLDFATAKILNEMSPTGIGDEAAFDQKYFALLTESELSVGANGFSVKHYKKNASNCVKAVYFARKGNGEGTYFIESVAKGQYDLTLITAFTVQDGDFAVLTVRAKKQTEDGGSFKQIFDKAYFDKFLQMVQNGNETFTNDEISAATGATTMNSVRGLNTAFTLAAQAMQDLAAYDDGIRAQIALRGDAQGGSHE